MSYTIVAMLDLNNRPELVLSTAKKLVDNVDGRIYSFTCVYEQDLSRFSSRKDAKHSAKTTALARMKTLVDKLGLEDTKVRLEVDWNEHIVETAVQFSARIGADLLITLPPSENDNVVQRDNKAWMQLLRQSCCPVLWLRSNGEHQHQHKYKQVLAAVAIDADNIEHDFLNNRIVAAAKRVARANVAQLGVVAALESTMNITQILKISCDEDEEKLSNEMLISRRFGVELNKVYLDYGPAEKVIAETVNKTQADLVVVGTIARAGISGALIGNTCEKLLRSLSVDLLIVN
jgi:nucleotide-binding universal stress UspA family protein